MDDDNLEELMEEFASEEAIASAKHEKALPEIEESVEILVRDYPKPQRELDLHGFTVPEALLETEYFVQRSIAHKLRTVRVITGRGLHSKNMVSVLPGEIEKKLAELKRSHHILAFKKEKSGGAFVVYLVS